VLRIVDRWSVRIRLCVGFGLGAVALLVVVAASLIGFTTAGTAGERSDSTRALAATAAEAKYAAADWNGWQTAYSLSQTRVAVDELSRMASELRGTVAGFTY
jgi:methyl-accepting chemotaxis protein